MGREIGSEFKHVWGANRKYVRRVPAKTEWQQREGAADGGATMFARYFTPQQRPS